MKNIKGQYASTFESLDGNDPEYDAPHAPIRVDGVTYLPAAAIQFATVADARGHRHGIIVMNVGPMGLNHTMSPAAMRAFATHMIDVATLIEAEAGGVSAAALQRAAGKPRP